MRVYVSSLGCKLNQAEMDALAAQLAAHNHQIVASPPEADLCIYNTCAVTHVAAQKSRQALRRLHRKNPQARLVVTGCYADLAPEELRNLPGVERVANNQEKESLLELLGLDKPSPQPPDQSPGPLPRTRTRAMVKIQDGCDNACTYCVIHVARGAQRSRPADQILAEVQARLAEDYREIVLTGVHIGAYGHDSVSNKMQNQFSEQEAGRAGPDLWSLVERILSETDVPRLRLSSIEPWDMSLGALPLWTDPRLCPHLHLPLQSGCDSILERMNRRYTTSKFSALVAAARHAIPNLAITTDVIVGFPGETDAEFDTSLAFVESLGFARVHVFPYSLREGTPAASMPYQVPPERKRARARAMRAVGAKSSQNFGRQFIGQTMDVLWEACHMGSEGRIWSGLTANYIRVYTHSEHNLANTIAPTRLLTLTKNGLGGELLGIKKAGDKP